MMGPTVLGGPLIWLIAVQFFVIPPAFLAIMAMNTRTHAGWVGAAFLVAAFSGILFVIARTNALTVPHQPGPIFPAQAGSFLLVWAGLNYGGMLFILRRRHKALFGAIELLVAAGTLVITANEMTRDTFLTTTLGFLGGIYVLVRGLTNIAEALDRSRATAASAAA
ncbi:MAG: hypothetical protein ACJ8ER_11915 [Allosphingosinicella sp.]